LYQKQLEVFLDPNDPAVIAQARKDGIADSVITAAQKSPVYKMAMDWKLALPLHPEYRTLPMVWYIPPLSPIQNAVEAGTLGKAGVIPDIRSLRIPVKYLANLLTAGDEEPIISALERLLAMRAYKRAEQVEGVEDLEVLQQAGLSKKQADEMYRYLAIANYEDRYVIPTGHREMNVPEAYGEKSGCGFTFGNGCSDGNNGVNMFGGKKITQRDIIKTVNVGE
jgi:nitrate reductase beta subunit